MDTRAAFQAWGEWADAGGLSSISRRQYGRYLERLFDHLDWKDWREITVIDLTGFVQTLDGSASTHLRAAALNFWRWLKVNAQAESNPVEYMPFTRQGQKIPESFSQEELERILSVALTINPRAPDILRFLYTTGARISEACGVRIEDVTDLGVTLRKTKRGRGKGSKERFIPFGPTARETARNLIEVRPWDDKHPELVIGMSKKTVGEWCQRISERTGIHVYAHRFRATFATDLLNRGANIRVVQEMCGHESILNTQRYTAVTNDQTRAAAQLLG